MKTRALYTLAALFTALLASAQITWDRSQLDYVKANIDRPYYATAYRAGRQPPGLHTAPLHRPQARQ
ncbi:MAG: hypothetical protein J6C95_02945 [Muribaculaceae bacterium]|nr:hypothetical protein [Muribaculaceae bacterium]